MSAAPLLEVRNLRIEFPTRRGTLVAVDDISLEIAPGRGARRGRRVGRGQVADRRGDHRPARAARTHRRTARSASPASASTSCRTRRCARIRGREIGAIFQDPLTSLNPLYTVGQQLIETITHAPRREQRRGAPAAIALLTSTGIPAPERRIDHYPHQFSGGMRQRVVIALALAAEPKLMIADEPTTALDVSIQAQIIALLKRLCREHHTAVMLVTHDMGVIAETADRVAVMYAGRIAEIGPVADVIHRPQHPYTVGLMGSIPALESEAVRLTQIDGSMPRLTAIPTGCAFHPRCTRAFDRCSRERPDLMPAGSGKAACWLHDAGSTRRAA